MRMDANTKISWERALKASGWMTVGAVLAFGALGIIGQVHFGKDAPAWVQAVGSVAAIVAAIIIAWLQHHQSRSDLEARDRRDEIARYVRANRILERFTRTIDEQMAAAVELRRSGRSGDLRVVPVPDEVRELEREMHLLSLAAGPGFFSINFFEEAQAFLRHQTLVHTDTEAFIEKLTNARELCRLALKEVRVYLG
ncbi:hypothetical protein XarbCFBP8149_07395 [Xanthomonas arboricola]|nr:hypothetical protein XarbCFBP8149_07395 [Xanthomonas arboricola]